MYSVVAHSPATGKASDGRSIGPFTSHSEAERAATVLAADRREWAVIRILPVEEDEE